MSDPPQDCGVLKPTPLSEALKAGTLDRQCERTDTHYEHIYLLTHIGYDATVRYYCPGLIVWEDDAMINHPPHYTFGKYEAIDVIEDWELGYHLGNVVKYVARADRKDNPVENLKKARWYLDREIERRMSANFTNPTNP